MKIKQGEGTRKTNLKQPLESIRKCNVSFQKTAWFLPDIWQNMNVLEFLGRELFKLGMRHSLLVRSKEPTGKKVLKLKSWWAGKCFFHANVRFSCSSSCLPSGLANFDLFRFVNDTVPPTKCETKERNCCQFFFFQNFCVNLQGESWCAGKLAGRQESPVSVEDPLFCKFFCGQELKTHEKRAWLILQSCGQYPVFWLRRTWIHELMTDSAVKFRSLPRSRPVFFLFKLTTSLCRSFFMFFAIKVQEFLTECKNFTCGFSRFWENSCFSSILEKSL